MSDAIESIRALKTTLFRRLLAIEIVLLSCLSAIPAQAQRIEGITTFGDSLVDNGNVYRSTGNTFPPSPPYSNGRFSNGAVWIENVISELRITNTSTNFAYGGATSGTLNTINSSLPGFSTELTGYFQTSPSITPDRLFVIWVGANDYIGGGQTNPAVTVGNVSTGIQTLITAGAKQFLVPNLPDLGRIPASSGNATLSAGLTILSAAHNSLLKSSLQTFAQNNPTVSIVPLDTASLFTAIISNPTRFGLTNVTDACLNQTTGVACTNPDAYLFWDTLHPTTAGTQIISAYALNTLTAPQTIATQAESALSHARYQSRDLDNHLIALRATPLATGKVNVFVNGDLNSGSRSTTTNITGFNLDTKGVIIGADYPVSDRLAVGIAFSNANSNNDLNSNKGKVSLNSSALAIYGTYKQDKFYADAAIKYGWDNFDLTRNIQVTGFTPATAKTSGNQFSARISGGYELGDNNLSIGPIVGLRYTNVKINGYTESNGDLLNLQVNPQNVNSFTLDVGARATYPIKTSFGTLSPYLAASYERELANNDRQIVTELLTQSGIPIRTTIGAVDRDYIRLSAGVQAQFSNELAGGLGYERVFSNNSIDNYLNAQVRYQF